MVVAIRCAASRCASVRACSPIACSCAGARNNSSKDCSRCSAVRSFSNNICAAPACDHHLGVAPLMIVCRGRKRNQQRRLARRRQLSHRAGAAACQDQIRRGELCRHVVKKRLHLPACSIGSARRILRSRRIGMARTGLVHDRQRRQRLQQARRNRRHLLVQHAATLAAAEDQQSQRSALHLSAESRRTPLARECR